MTIAHATPATLVAKLSTLRSDQSVHTTQSVGYAPYTPFADLFHEAFGDLGTGAGNCWLPTAAEVGLNDEWLRPEVSFELIDPVDPAEELDLDELPWGFHLV